MSDDRPEQPAQDPYATAPLPPPYVQPPSPYATPPPPYALPPQGPPVPPLPTHESDLGLETWWPSAGLWSAGKRIAQCAVRGADGKTVGTLRGARR